MTQNCAFRLTKNLDSTPAKRPTFSGRGKDKIKGNEEHTMTNNERGNQIQQRRRTIMPKVSQEKLAEKAGVSLLTLGRIERGLNTNPFVETVEAIESALDHFERPVKDAEKSTQR